MTRHRRTSSDHGDQSLSGSVQQPPLPEQEQPRPHPSPPPPPPPAPPPPPPPPPPPSTLSQQATQFFGPSPDLPSGKSFGSPENVRSSSMDESIAMDYSDTSNEQQQERSRGQEEIAKSTTTARRSKRDRESTTSTELSAFREHHHHQHNPPTRSRRGRAGLSTDWAMDRHEIESQTNASASFPSPTFDLGTWVLTKLAYSFRSPPPPSSSNKRLSSNLQHPMSSHRHHDSDPYLRGRSQPIPDRRGGGGDSPAWSSESTPLVKDRKTGGGGASIRANSSQVFPNEADPADVVRRVRIAAAFLGDYEASRPPTLPSRVEDITDRQLQWHEIKYSTMYVTIVWLAALLLFLSSGFEYVVRDEFGSSVGSLSAGAAEPLGRLLMTAFNLVSVLVLAADLIVLYALRAGGGARSSNIAPGKGLTSPHIHPPSSGGGAMPPSLSYYYFEDDQSHVFMTSTSSARDPYNINDSSRIDSSSLNPPRSSDSHRLVKPVVLFATFLAIENLARVSVGSVVMNASEQQTLWNSTYAERTIATTAATTASAATYGIVLMSSVFKPIVLFYVSSQARHALEALRRILYMVIRVLIMESLLILMFAAVGCRLFAGYEQFENLSTAWISLFELSTTVVNPSIWMPMYRDYRASAVFFIFFVVVCVFYLHSLVLSVVFSTYIYAAGEIFERSASDREDALRLAYRALLDDDDAHRRLDEGMVPATSATSMNLEGDGGMNGVGIKISRLRPLLQRLRPHYNASKISALWEIMDPNIHLGEGSDSIRMDYPTFRQKIRQALNASIRTPRTATKASIAVELMAVVVAVVNFVYVLVVSSRFDESWIEDSTQAVVGCIISVVASVELLIRFNPLRIADFVPLTRLNTTFDGLALTAATISAVGIALLPYRPESALEIILTGRALDMIRVMRFFRIFRDVVRRSADVLPAVLGPLVLVLSTLHVFVYLGIALWGGAIRIGENSAEVEPLYDLNNFNSYQEGIVTMFQVLVVNDWHSVAKVFLYADRCSQPWIVYPFFVLGNLIGVSIMLNVLTAFFVESFVTKINDDSDEIVAASEGEGGGDTATAYPRKRKCRGDFTIQTPENSRTIRRISSSTSSLLESQQPENSFDAGGGDADDDASDGSESAFFEFDVYEREGLDKIMQTVAGIGSSVPYHSGEYARQLCDYFEIFESLASEREPVGFLVCDQLTMERFGNRRFQNLSVGFMEASDLHAIVSEMHSELLALATRAPDRSLIRSFHQDRQVFEITGSLLRRHPALSLFVTRVRKS